MIKRVLVDGAGDAEDVFDFLSRQSVKKRLATGGYLAVLE